MKLRLKAGGLTDIGLKRDHNEDYILLSDELGLFAVADGMGGHAAGEVASKTAISEIHEYFSKAGRHRVEDREVPPVESLNRGEGLLQAAIAKANTQLCLMSEENSQYFGMGTTIAAIYLGAGHIHIAHVGDSRIYRLRGQNFEMLTQDHSWVNEQLQKNIITEEQARTHRFRNVITRALGNRIGVEIDIQTIPAEAGDLFLICSDGLTTMLEDSVIHKTVWFNAHNLERAADELVTLANKAGGHDNISVVLLRVEEVAGDNETDESKAPEDQADTKPDFNVTPA